jgi:superfamily II DNA or RNA helicase
MVFKLIEEKVIPHMTFLVRIIRNEKVLRSFLESIKIGINRSQAGILLKKYPSFSHYSDGSIDRFIMSLITYSFIHEDEHLILSELSNKYLDGDINYQDYILSCLTSNLEWAYFLPDLIEIVDGKTPIKKSEIISALDKCGYSIDSLVNVNRYLQEIFPSLEIAGVIEYKNGVIISLNRNATEVNKFTKKTQKELINLLLMVERRNIHKKTFRRIYRATVKSYLPLRKYRSETRKTQKEIEYLRKKKVIEDKESKVEYPDSKWKLSDELWNWQEDMKEKWMKERNGIVKVVTGAGKTHLAMAIIEDLFKYNNELTVTIIVPTIVLMHQWKDNLVNKLQINPRDISLRGGGFRGSFKDKKILISVINSAIKDDYIERITSKLTSNLLIVDECHRAGAKQFSRIFNTNRKYSLGLSATPERESDDAFNNVLVKELGDIVGTYTYNDALNDGIIPPFDIYNYAVILTNEEKIKYDKISKEIQNIVKRLKFKYSILNKSNTKMEIELNILQKKNPNDKDLFQYFLKTKERKNDIIYPAKNRKRAVFQLLNSVLAKNEINSDTPLKGEANDKVIVFHEKINEINNVFVELDSDEVSIYHSGFPKSLNRIGLDLYKSGETRILLSVKALIEGVDVPNTNLGIIMASSSSQTQRVQSLGRVLRKAPGKNLTKLFIIYVKNSTDERIYQKTNWSDIIGKGNIYYTLWTEYGEFPINPPLISKPYEEPPEIEVKEEELQIGGEYPGNYKGRQLSFDSNGRLFEKRNEKRRYLDVEMEEVWNRFRKYKPSGGRLLLTDNNYLILKDPKDKRIIFLGKMELFESTE